jgi:hypothetical protein
MFLALLYQTGVVQTGLSLGIGIILGFFARRYPTPLPPKWRES